MRWFSGRTSGSGSWLRERDDVIRGEMGRKDIGDVTSSRISRRSRHLVYLGGHVISYISEVTSSRISRRSRHLVYLGGHVISYISEVTGMVGLSYWNIHSVVFINTFLLE